MENINERLKFETRFWDEGFDYVIGADEVGRGCIAGPLVTAAVVWEKEKVLAEFEIKDCLIHQIRDSKKISKNVRYKLSYWVLQNALGYARTEVSASVIDEKGIQFANRFGMAESVRKCAESLPSNAKIIAITDHLDISNEINIPCFPLIHGDNLSFTVASASIVAKVHRDAYMSVVAHNEYPNYGFNSHVGYGTQKHSDAISKYGLTEIHRKTFVTLAK